MSKRKKEKSKIYHVEMKTMYKGRKHYYFGSKAAIYECIPESLVGVPLKYLWKNGYMSVFDSDGVYRNAHLTIRMGELDRKNKNRGGVKLTEDEIKRLNDE